MVSDRGRGRLVRALRLVLWGAVIMLLAGGALAYSCAPAASASGRPPGQAVTVLAGE